MVRKILRSKQKPEKKVLVNNNPKTKLTINRKPVLTKPVVVISVAQVCYVCLEDINLKNDKVSFDEVKNSELHRHRNTCKEGSENWENSKSADFLNF